MVGGHLGTTRQERVLKGGAVRIVLRVETRLFDKFPQPLKEIEIGGLPGQVQQFYAQRLGEDLHQGTALIAGSVQDEGDRQPRVRSRQQPQQLTHGRRGNGGEICDREQVMGGRMQRGQDLEALAAGGGFDKQPLHTPENPQKGGKHEVSRIQEKDGAAARLGFG